MKRVTGVLLFTIYHEHLATHHKYYNTLYAHFTGSEAVHQSYKNSTVVDDHKNVSQRVMGYTKPAYPVLVGNSVKVFPTNVFALLPQHNKFLIKERLHDPTVGYVRAKLVLRSSGTEAEHNIRY